jgi:hypothetical protein
LELIQFDNILEFNKWNWNFSVNQSQAVSIRTTSRGINSGLPKL